MFHLATNQLALVGKKLSEGDKQLICSTFHDVDEDHKNYLTREDVKVAVVMLFGYKPSKYEVDQMFDQEFKKNGHSKGLCLETFIDVMSTKMCVQDEDEEIRHTFLAFDSQCKGFLTLDDLMKVYSEVAPHISTHRVQAAFREIDRDGDGRVGYKDFEFMMKYSLQDDL